jgi:hypothetical protein
VLLIGIDVGINDGLLAKVALCKVTIQLISMVKLMIASNAAQTAIGSIERKPAGKKPRPWNELMLMMKAYSGDIDS